MAGDVAFEWSTDVGAAAWIDPACDPPGRHLGALIPGGYGAYCRLFHPAWRDDGPGGMVVVRWWEIAEWAGRAVHPEMQFEGISRPSRPPTGAQPWTHEPGLGPSDDDTTVLPELLTEHTSTPDACWFATWEGQNDPSGRTAFVQMSGPTAPSTPEPDDDAMLSDADLVAFRRSIPPPDIWSGPRAAIGGFDYLLYRGTARTPGPMVEPAYWWPDDRAWIVVSHFDFPCTYVGGSQALIDAIVADPRLEALPASLTDDVMSDGDAINR
jgi:hypothetical protein